ncbi:MAG: nicotinate-nucleotide adenylyltransferase [Lachnospiraceae bacterium]|nr:nicotinate-nucleotide adenylyltransferase [Lachnospiraceae bacterium]
MATDNCRKIGIMGGTFDPIHNGHLLIAQSAAEEFSLNEVIFLPTGISPHKNTLQVTSPKLRCQMTKLAITDNPIFSLSEIEAENTKTNYTYKTLKKIQEVYKNAHLYFIMGEDSLNDFSGWREPQKICDAATLLVAVRNDGNSDIQMQLKQVKEQYKADIYLLHAPNFSVSSSDIRKKIQSGKSVRYMLPSIVEDFIRQNALYTNI